MDEGELLIIAPGVERFGEQPEVDEIIRRFGYRGMPNTMQHYATEKILQDFAHAIAHLIYGSSAGLFTIRYTPGKLIREEIEAVGYEFMELNEAMARYNPQVMKEGWNTMADGEEVFFISTPAAGLWAHSGKLKQ